jgi:sigma-B regulation protein RsbU (phosphoserine phosphatase)
VTEAENRENALYSEERLLDLLSKQRCQIPCTMVDVVLNDVNKHVNGAEQSDDITIMSIIINNLKHK